MRRRDFIAGLMGAAWCSLARAQSTVRHFRIGMLDTSPRQRNANFGAFQEALRERGYMEGQNLIFEYRSADGGNRRFAAPGERTGAPRARRRDRGKDGDAPTALRRQSGEHDCSGGDGGGRRSACHRAQRRAAGPQHDRVWRRRARHRGQARRPSQGADPACRAHRRPHEPVEPIAAGGMGSEIEARRAGPRRRRRRSSTRGRSRASDSRSTAAIAPTSQAALVVGSDTVMQANQSRVIELAAAHRLPAIYTFRDYVDAGGLASYGVSLPALYRQAAAYVDRILQGAKPDELPIEPPAKFELVINLNAAKALSVQRAERAAAQRRRTDPIGLPSAPRSAPTPPKTSRSSPRKS